MKLLPKIKKCSFVLGEPRVRDSVMGFYVCQAYKNSLAAIGPTRKTVRGAINIWNRRVK